MRLADGLVIAAPSSGSGKTVVTFGLLAALRRRGIKVAGAKTGPDYLDPRFHEQATGRTCFNLDPWTMRPGLIADLAARRDADLVVIEGVMGLFDGPIGGGGSTADLAAMLGLPVVLVVDAARQGQSIAALVEGFARHRADLGIAGVIVNRLASDRHRALVASALHDSGAPLLGAVMADPRLRLPSRHLGLVQADEIAEIAAVMAHAADAVAESVNIDALLALARPIAAPLPATPLPPLGQRVAVASDIAFAFTYRHILDGWSRLGAELVPFSPLNDEAPAPDADAVFLPGGYPELHAERIAGNAGFMDGLARAARRGILIYGECGGYMVLGKGLTDGDGHRHGMAGLLPHETSFVEPRLHLGYRRFRHQSPLPWPRLLRGHEFHYASLSRAGDGEALFAAAGSEGQALPSMGTQSGRVMGSFAHIVDGEW
jgi:cobyrinic acid a,c-diamide synthase